MRRTALVIAATVSMAAGGAFAQNASQAQRVTMLVHEYAAPQKVIAALDTRDQKFNSPGCQEARKNAQG